MTAEQGADFAGSWEKEASKTGPLNAFVRKPHCKLRKERGSFCSRSTVGRAVPNTPEKSDQMRTVLPSIPCAGASLALCHVERVSASFFRHIIINSRISGLSSNSLESSSACPIGV